VVMNISRLLERFVSKNKTKSLGKKINQNEIKMKVELKENSS